MVEECGGRVPDDPILLRKMPGIGDYTAGAILSIAYGQKEPAVDGNATRVFARVEEIYEDVLKPKTIANVKQIIQEMMPDGQAGELTESIMELGALICLPQQPKCDQCPICEECKAKENGKTDVLPYRSGPKPKKIEHRLIILAQDENQRILMRKRRERLLHNLWEYINVPMDQEGQTVLHLLGLEVQSQQEIGSAQHVFTHIIWKMKGIYADVRGAAPEGYEWVEKEQIKEKAVPTALAVFTKWGEQHIWK